MNISNPSGLAFADTASHADAFELCASKIRRNLPDLLEKPASWAWDPGGDYPSWSEGFFDIGNWTTSFFTGMGVLAFTATQDREWLELVERFEPLYEAKIGAHGAETMHDLGFLYSLYAVALCKTAGKARHRELGLKAASLLADRFVSEGNFIRAWGRMDEQETDYAGLAIIDSLMNMPLLHWASAESGDPKFREIAIGHTDTTLQHLVRADDSVYHAFRFDRSSGAPVGADNYCGASVESRWARGTTWAMYGFALAFRHTGDQRYLEASLRLTRQFLASLDEDPVPVWDFRLEPGAEPVRDSSAAAIAVCAIQELQALDSADGDAVRMKQSMLDRLCSADYLDTSPGCRGVLKQGQVGDGPGKARSAYTSWGDYFFMQALARETGLTVSWW